MGIKLNLLLLVIVIFSLNISLLAQRKAEKPVKASVVSNSSISFIDSEHPHTFLKRNPAIVLRLKRLLKNNYQLFYEGLSVSSGLRKYGDYYITSGCIPHDCPDGSYFAINSDTVKVKTSTIYGIIRNTEWNNQYKFYSEHPQKKVPLELASYAEIDFPAYSEYVFLPNYINRSFSDNFRDGKVVMTPRFLGNSLWRIFKILDDRQSNIYKDEFETTPQFMQRRENELSKPLMESLTIKDRLAFRSEIYCEYNADLSEMKISFAATPCNLTPYSNKILSPDFSCISVSELVDTSTYAGTDRYGRTVSVLKNTTEIYGLVIEGAAKWKKERDEILTSFERYIFYVPMKVDVARRVKDTLEVLFVGTLDEPFTAKGFSKTAATMQKPQEEIENKYFLTLKIEDVLLFDSLNGTVVSKIQIPR